MNQSALDKFAEDARELAEESHGIASIHAHGDLRGEESCNKVTKELTKKVDELIEDIRGMHAGE